MVIENKYNIKVLDCTLRDGGYVNNFNFGETNIHKIVNSLSRAHTDVIELGFLKSGKHDINHTLFNYVSEAEQYTVDSVKNQEFCLMIRPDWYDINNLKKSDNIKYIRFAFHYGDIELLKYQSKIAKKLGYEIFFNPVNVFGYTNNQLKKLLNVLNELKPKGIYIVDTFGSMLPKDLKKTFSIFNTLLDKDIALGLHLHENLSISLSLAIDFIELIGNSRECYIDSSINGMGRIPGNLCTELIMNYLNIYQKKEIYNLEEVYNLIDSIILKIKKSIPWGYSPEYSISAFCKVHRSYPEYFMNYGLSLIDMSNIIHMIKLSNKGKEFDENYAKKLYNKYLLKND